MSPSPSSSSPVPLPLKVGSNKGLRHWTSNRPWPPTHSPDHGFIGLQSPPVLTPPSLFLLPTFSSENDSKPSRGHPLILYKSSKYFKKIYKMNSLHKYANLNLTSTSYKKIFDCSFYYLLLFICLLFIFLLFVEDEF